MRGILFDLDGTLLDIDLRTFLGRYFGALSKTLAAILPDGDPSGAGIRAVTAASDAMILPHAGRTNREVFNAEFERLTAIDLDAHQATLDRFYAEEFPSLGDGYGPAPGSRHVVETALELGLEVAVATNPIFPRAAIDHRLAWAGLGDIEFRVVTSYEWMCATKPHAAYFRQTAEAIGIEPTACLMVGDDRALDLPAADVGMRTYYVGSATDSSANYRGCLDDLAALLPRLTA